jgi:hypothetical protein
MGSSLFSHLCNVGKLAGFSGTTPYFLIVRYPPEYIYSGFALGFVVYNFQAGLTGKIHKE